MATDRVTREVTSDRQQDRVNRTDQWADWANRRAGKGK